MTNASSLEGLTRNDRLTWKSVHEKSNWSMRNIDAMRHNIEMEIIFIDFTWVCSLQSKDNGDEQVQASSYMILEKMFLCRDK